MFDIKEEDGTTYDPGIKFYENMAGSFAVGRLSSSMDVTQNTMQIAKIIDNRMPSFFDEAIHSETLSHNLGYVPEVMGLYYLSGFENRRMMGDWVYIFDDTEYSPYPVGYLWIDNVTDKTVTVSYTLNPYFPGYNDSYEKMEFIMRLYLLKNESV